MTGPAVIVPVHNGAELLPAALTGFLAAVRPLDGSVVVVDDNSADGTAALARRLGADVIVLDDPAGPYAARNAGWQASGADVAVFVDVRCRPRPGWLPALLAALQRPGAALAGGDVVVLPGTSVAGRAAARLQPLAAANGRAAAFLPYTPTCHLAAPIEVLKAMGGFHQVRGGGDVDFCWRVQLAGLGSIEWAEEAVLEWEPRRRVRDLVEQYHRYGANTRRLYRAYREQGCPEPPAAPTARLVGRELKAWAAAARHESPRRWAELAVAGAARVAYGRGYRQGSNDGAAN